MAEQTITIDGRTVRAGTAEDAGRLCVSARSPQGLTPERYRHYYYNAGTAPGPIMVTNPANPDGPPVPARDSATGGKLFDLDAVERWNAARPGRGGWHWSSVTADTLKHTEARGQLLLAARDGRLCVTDTGHTEVDGQVQPRRVAQSRTSLQRLGVLGEKDAQGRVPLTELGIKVLARWEVT